MLLEIVSFNPSLLYNILGIVVILGTVFGAFFNIKNQVELLKNDLKNAVEQTTKLELKTAADYTKIERKISELEDKSEDRHKDLQTRIDKMPMEIINILRNINKE